MPATHAAAQSQIRKARFERPEERERQRELTRQFCDTDWYKAKHKANTSALWQDPEYRAKQAAGMKAVMSTPEYKEKQSARQKAWWANPDNKKAAMEKRLKMKGDKQGQSSLSKVAA